MEYDLTKLKKTEWNEQTASELKAYMSSLKEEGYAAFSEKLIKTEREIIGIRSPLMMKIVKAVVGGDSRGFLDTFNPVRYEEVNLYGCVINVAKLSEEERCAYFLKYIPFIDNWASCDCISTKPNMATKTYFEFLRSLVGKDCWHTRFGLHGMMTAYVTDEYIDDVLQTAITVRSDEYYVQMCNAWLLCDCLIKQYDKTFAALDNCNLDAFTLRKAVSKCCDSFRLTAEQKEFLRGWLKKKLGK